MKILALFFCIAVPLSAQVAVRPDTAGLIGMLASGFHTSSGSSTVFNLATNATMLGDLAAFRTATSLTIGGDVQAYADALDSLAVGDVATLNSRVVVAPGHAHYINVKDYGAKGDGKTNDAIAITNAWNAAKAFTHFATLPNDYVSKIASAAIYFPAGDYIFNGSSLDASLGGVINIVGDGREVTRIQITSDDYLIKTTNAVYSLSCRGIRFYGGKGFWKHAYSSINVLGQYVIENCSFANYTEAAICSLSTDMPYWKISQCTFYGTNTAKGIALGGAADKSEISSNSFLLNHYHMKLANGGNNVTVRGNDFIRFANGRGSPALVDIWIVPFGSPVNGGNGCQITGNKFGNENLNSADYKILVADQGPGTDFADKNHVTSISTGYWVGFTVKDNYSALANSNTNGLVYSYTPAVYGFRIVDNTFVGGSQTLVKLDSAVTYENENRIQDLGFVDALGEVDASEGLPAVALTRQGMAIVDDPLGLQQGRPGSVKRYPVGFDPAYTPLIDGGGDTTKFRSSPGTQKNITTDAIGGENALEIVYDRNGASIYQNLNGVIPGRRAWLEVELKQANTNSLSAAEIAIRSSDGGQIAVKRVVAVQNNWTTYRIPWVPRQSTTGLLVYVASAGWVSGSAERLIVGRARVYHSDEPVSPASLDFGEGNSIYNPPSLSGGQRASTTLTIVGAILGDFVLTSFGTSLKGIHMWGEVTAADTVTVYFENTTGGTINLSAAKLTARTFRPTR